MMSGLRFTTISLNLPLCRAIRPSGKPLAPSVCSGTLGACCLKTSGVILRGPRRSPAPRPGPHDVTSPHTASVTNTVNVSADRISHRKSTIQHTTQPQLHSWLYCPYSVNNHIMSAERVTSRPCWTNVGPMFVTSAFVFLVTFCDCRQRAVFKHVDDEDRTCSSWLERHSSADYSEVRRRRRCLSVIDRSCSIGDVVRCDMSTQREIEETRLPPAARSPRGPRWTPLRATSADDAGAYWWSIDAAPPTSHAHVDYLNHFIDHQRRLLDKTKSSKSWPSEIDSVHWPPTSSWENDCTLWRRQLAISCSAKFLRTATNTGLFDLAIC